MEAAQSAIVYLTCGSLLAIEESQKVYVDNFESQL